MHITVATLESALVGVAVINLVLLWTGYWPFKKSSLVHAVGFQLV